MKVGDRFVNVCVWITQICLTQWMGGSMGRYFKLHITITKFRSLGRAIYFQIRRPRGSPTASRRPRRPRGPLRDGRGGQPQIRANAGGVQGTILK